MAQFTQKVLQQTGKHPDSAFTIHSDTYARCRSTGLQCFDTAEWATRRVCGPTSQALTAWPRLLVGSRPSDHYFRGVCLFVCAEFFSAVFDPIWIKL